MNIFIVCAKRTALHIKNAIRDGGCKTSFFHEFSIHDHENKRFNLCVFIANELFVN